MARPYRLIIWGPGEVGGAVLRAAHASDRFEIVGVKVFSPHKHGKDAGELVGIGPIGVKATRKKAEILALDADCVIVTPQPRAVLEGIDADVIDLLESGKSVVSTAAYHDVAMPNWFNRAGSPTARLREIAHTRGAAVHAWERLALWLVRALTAIRALDPITDVLFRPVANRRIPARASAARLLQACKAGNSALHGTGVHPTFMVERLLMRMCRALSKVSHIRFAESGDFARAPEGMWGGLSFFGFGRDPRDLDADWVVAKAGDFYYGDLIGNVAHALHGARPDEVRLERSLRGIPAARDLQVGSTVIEAGTTAALHMVHRGYLGDHCFFTNEECWYLGADNAYHGDDVPFGRIPAHGGYTFEITGEPASIRGQISSSEPHPGMNHAITTMSVNALLDAVGPVCRARPGVIIDDARPQYRPEEAVEPERAPERAASGQRRPYRVVVLGSDEAGAAVRVGAQADARFELVEVASRDDVLAAEVDCVVVTREPGAASEDAGALVVASLEAGKDVVTTAAEGVPAGRLREACERGGASVHRIGFHATWVIERTVMTMVQGVSAVRHIRVVEALDLAVTPERRREAAALGLGEGAGGEGATEEGAAGGETELQPAGSEHLAHVIATVARDLYAGAATSVRIERTCRRIPAERRLTIEGGLVIEPGTVAATCTIHRGYVEGRCFFTSEQWRYLGAEDARRGEDLPYGGFRGATSYAVQIQADPADLEAQWELEPVGAADPIAGGCARMILDAIGPVCEAGPGILLEDPRPRYQHDDRVERDRDRG